MSNYENNRHPEMPKVWSINNFGIETILYNSQWCKTPIYLQGLQQLFFRDEQHADGEPQIANKQDCVRIEA